MRKGLIPVRGKFGPNKIKEINSNKSMSGICHWRVIPSRKYLVILHTEVNIAVLEQEESATYAYFARKTG